MKDFTKKIIALGMSAALLTCTVTACNKTAESETSATSATAASSESQPSEEPTESEPTESQTSESEADKPADVVGGWSIPESKDVTAEAKEAFEKAAGQVDGFTYEPTKLLATQVVAGTNYCIFCKSTVEAQKGPLDYAIVYINVDPSGNAKVLRQDTIVLGAETEENLDGGWCNAESPEVTPEIEGILKSACEGLTGANYKAVGYVGSQVVAGMNYAILCEVTPVIPDAVPTYAIVYVYEDTAKKCKIDEVVDFPLDATSESGNIG